MSIYVRDHAGNRVKIAGVGKSGADGKNAYQYAVDGGFTGTEVEFAISMGARSNANLLDNWYFIDPINQRKKKKYTEAGYTIDRWQTRGGVSALCIRDSYTSVAAQLVQPIENGELLLAGKTVTISALTHEGQIITASDLIVLADKEVLLAAAFDCGSIALYREGDGQIYFQINPDVGKEIGLLAAKLELAPVQTLARQDAAHHWVLNDPSPDRALELTKCRRYYYRHAGWYYLLKNGSTDSQAVSIAFSPPMRIAPAVTLVRGNGIEQITTSTTSDCLLAYKNGDVSTALGIYEFVADANL